MPDYKEMYLVLFRETTKAIEALKKAQQTTEEIYIDDEGDDGVQDAGAKDTVNGESSHK